MQFEYPQHINVFCLRNKKKSLQLHARARIWRPELNTRGMLGSSTTKIRPVHLYRADVGLFVIRQYKLAYSIGQ